jgi:hypothetical protein
VLTGLIIAYHTTGNVNMMRFAQAAFGCMLVMTHVGCNKDQNTTASGSKSSDSSSSVASPATPAVSPAGTKPATNVGMSREERIRFHQAKIKEILSRRKAENTATSASH